MTTATQKLTLKKVGYVIVYVNDMKAAVEFYKEKLGLAPRFEDAEWTELETEGMTLALHAAKQAPSVDGERGPVVVFSVDDVRGAHAALKDAGVGASDLHQVCEHDGMIGLSTDFRDPAGNRLSVYGMVKK